MSFSTIDIEELKKQSEKRNLEDLLKKFSWKDFEKVVAEVFRMNEFEVKENFRFKTKKIYEIDVFARKFNTIFCVDCKSWGKGRYKKSGLKRAAKLQEKRVLELKKIIKKGPLVSNNLNKNRELKILPLVVTLYEEDLIKENETFFVPIYKLNSFLQTFELYF